MADPPNLQTLPGTMGWVIGQGQNQASTPLLRKKKISFLFHPSEKTGPKKILFSVYEVKIFIRIEPIKSLPLISYLDYPLLKKFEKKMEFENVFFVFFFG